MRQERRASCRKACRTSLRARNGRLGGGRPVADRSLAAGLNHLALAYNTVEAIVSIAAGLVAGSVALVGFGVDSGIEVTASVAAQWRLRADIDAVRRERVERVARRVIGASFWCSRPT
jgi:hypothetical protein